MSAGFTKYLSYDKLENSSESRYLSLKQGYATLISKADMYNMTEYFDVL